MVDDLLNFLGVECSVLATSFGDDTGTVGAGSGSVVNGSLVPPQMDLRDSNKLVNDVSKIRNTGELEIPVNGVLDPLGSIPGTVPGAKGAMQFTEEQVTECIKL